MKQISLPNGYYYLSPGDAINDGDVYWSDTLKQWQETSNGGDKYTVRSSGLVYARKHDKNPKKMNIRQQIEEKEKELKELVEAEKNALFKDAEEKGFKKGARLSNGEVIDSLVIVTGIEHAKTFSTSSADYWRKHKIAFVAAWYGGVYCCPIAELAITKVPALPTINGYAGKYTQGSQVMVYGCAVLSVNELKYYAGGPSVYPAEVTRRVMSVEFDSGIKLTLQNLCDIMQHVNYVNNN